MANTNHTAPAPWHLWVVGILLLLWQGMAVFDYIATVIRFEPYLSNYPDELLEYYFNAPAWMYAAWAVAAFGGFLSAIFLLLRNKIALLIAILAFLSSLLTVVYTFLNPPPGSGGELVFLITAVSAGFLVLAYMYWLKRRGVLR